MQTLHERNMLAIEIDSSKFIHQAVKDKYTYIYYIFYTMLIARSAKKAIFSP